MNESEENRLYDANIEIVASRLFRLQDNLKDLESKLNKTVSSLQVLMDQRANEELDAEEEGDCETEPSEKIAVEELHRRKKTRMKKAKKAGDKVYNDKARETFGRKKYSWETCDYWSLPKWLQSNGYILKGYRPPLPVQECFFSIFRIHTETVNIWTHLFGCLLFMILFLHVMISSIPFPDKMVMCPFFLGAILCLFMSSMFHTLQCHSEATLAVTSRLDYCGISILILGSFVPWLNYAFYCDTKVKLLYMYGVASLSVCAVILSLSRTFNHPLYRPLRATVFTAIGLSGVVPSIHFILLDGWAPFISMAVPLVLTGFLYIVGTIIYAVRFPERVFPGKCDILFHSHQLFHIMVVLATLVDYVGILRVVAFLRFARTNPDFCVQKQYYYGRPHDQFFNF